MKHGGAPATAICYQRHANERSNKNTLSHPSYTHHYSIGISKLRGKEPASAQKSYKITRLSTPSNFTFVMRVSATLVPALVSFLLFIVACLVQYFTGDKGESYLIMMYVQLLERRSVSDKRAWLPPWDFTWFSWQLNGEYFFSPCPKL